MYYPDDVIQGERYEQLRMDPDPRTSKGPDNENTLVVRKRGKHNSHSSHSNHGPFYLGCVLRSEW